MTVLLEEVPLVQRSEYHSQHDGYYTDWFQVDDKTTAKLIDRTLDGSDIERRWDAPTIYKTNGTYRFHGVEAK